MVGVASLFSWVCCQVTMVMDQVMGLRHELELSASRYTHLQQEKQDEVRGRGRQGHREGERGEEGGRG